MFLQRIRTTCTRYAPVCFQAPVPFSTIDVDVSLNSIPKSPFNCNIDESHVLSQLSDLLPISSSSSSSLSSSPVTPNSPAQLRAVDDFLLPEEKLRGVFLQKLSGKSAVQRALSSINVELNIDVYAKVVNRGDLSGESMIMFHDWAIQQPNMPNDVRTYRVILKALGRRKFCKHMMYIFCKMKDIGIAPDLYMLAIVVDSFLHARQVSRAVKVFGELEVHGLKRDAETINVVLQCLCRRSHVGTACSLFKKAKENVSLDGTSYNIIIGGWAKCGRVSEVEKFLELMVDDGMEPDCVTYTHVLESLGRAGRVTDAVKIFEYLKEKESILSTGVYNAMIFNLVAVGDIDGALKYYKQMLSSSNEPNVDTYTRVISAFLKVRRVADAIEMFDEMLGCGIVPSTGSVTAIIQPLCRHGPPHAALMIYKKARKCGCRISLSAYKMLLMRLSRFGKCGMLMDIWYEMQESGHSSDTEDYEYVINCLCNNGQLETAVTVMEESLCKGFFPSKLICSKLNNKLMASNKIDTAYKLFLKLKKARLNENAQRYWRAKGWHF